MCYGLANSSLIKGSLGRPLLPPSVSLAAIVLSAHSSWKQAVWDSKEDGIFVSRGASQSGEAKWWIGRRQEAPVWHSKVSAFQNGILMSWVPEHVKTSLLWQRKKVLEAGPGSKTNEERVLPHWSYLALEPLTELTCAMWSYLPVMHNTQSSYWSLAWKYTYVN